MTQINTELSRFTLKPAAGKPAAGHLLFAIQVVALWQAILIVPMGGQNQGIAGMNPLRESDATPGSAFAVPGPVGMDALIPLVARIIARVNDDWHPPAPDTTPTTSLTADTLADLSKLLPRDEWGQGGGALRSERIPVGTSTNLTVQLHGNLVLRLPEWTNAASASAAAQSEWNRLVAKLRVHEQRHLDIAIEEFDKVGPALVGQDIDQIVAAVTAANAAAKKRQDDLDTATDHGSRKGVQYGDVFLDTSIT